MNEYFDFPDVDLDYTPSVKWFLMGRWFGFGRAPVGREGVEDGIFRLAQRDADNWVAAYTAEIDKEIFRQLLGFSPQPDPIFKEPFCFLKDLNAAP